MVNATKETLNPMEEFDWIQLKTDIGSTPVETETFTSKFNRKFASNPLVPVGCLTTAVILGAGLWNFRKGNSRNSQLLMRMRVLAQGFTVAAMIVGVAVAAVKR